MGPTDTPSSAPIDIWLTIQQPATQGNIWIEKKWRWIRMDMQKMKNKEVSFVLYRAEDYIFASNVTNYQIIIRESWLYDMT